MLKGLLCGIGGGLVGICVWATLAHFTGSSADYAAWIVGMCTGVGVAFGAQPKLNVLTGLLAMALTSASVIVSSFAAAEFATGHKVEVARLNVSYINVHGALEALEHDITAEWAAEDARAAADHAGDDAAPMVPALRPRDAAAEAKLRWAAMGTTERRLYRDHLSEQRSAEAGHVDMPLEFAGYFSRMTIMQIVWGSLALVTGFKIGATPGRSLDEMERTIADAAARNNPILRGEPMGAVPRVFPPGATGPSTSPSPHIAPSARKKAA